jgi:uncharacterized membrane protein YjgN (DUF898 family)
MNLENTIPLPPPEPRPDSSGARMAAQPAVEMTGGYHLPVSFTGSGSEYFRIWTVNLLLTFATLGLYYPWAKVRKLRYFYGNTTVGEHSFDFHGNPKRMLRGLLLVGAMVLLYSLAGHVSPVAGLIALVIVAAVWPALFRASQQFRMANTSWRGLRFRFSGDMAGAYRAMLPFFVPGVLSLGALMVAGEPTDAEHTTRAQSAAGGLVALAGLLTLALAPLLIWLLKKYQHGHYALGQVQTEMRAGAGSFYLLGLKTFGVAMLGGVVAFVLAIVFAGGGSLVMLLGGHSAGRTGAVLLIVLMMILSYAAVILLAQPFFLSRFQNLVWGRTESHHIRFESTLRFRPLLWLTVKNWFLTAITLGFYWPFAKIAMTRLRLEAVSVHTLLSPDDLVTAVRVRADDASGDAAGDLFGIDIGL